MDTPAQFINIDVLSTIEKLSEIRDKNGVRVDRLPQDKTERMCHYAQSFENEEDPIIYFVLIDTDGDRFEFYCEFFNKNTGEWLFTYKYRNDSEEAKIRLSFILYDMFLMQKSNIPKELEHILDKAFTEKIWANGYLHINTEAITRIEEKDKE